MSVLNHYLIYVAKAVYQNKDWNFLLMTFLLLLSFLLQKPSTKTRIETILSTSKATIILSLQKPSTKTRIETLFSRYSHIFLHIVAKAVYQNKDWNIFTSFLFLYVSLLVAKAVYQNKDWNNLLLPYMPLGIRTLQKPSTKTRIETLIILTPLSWALFLVAKAVYQNKDWNMSKQGFSLLTFFSIRCKSRLPKQGLKQLSLSALLLLLLRLQKPSTKTRIETILISYTIISGSPLQKPSTKTRIETFNLPSHQSSYYQSCKSRLPKQGLKQSLIMFSTPALSPRCKSRLPKQGLKQFRT